MAIWDFGEEHLRPSRLNANFLALYTILNLNSIRTLQAGGLLHSIDSNDSFTELYSAASGARSTVDTGNTTAEYDATNDVYLPGSTALDNSTLTTHDPDSVSNPENFFDGSAGTNATASASGSGTRSVDKVLGKTFTEKNIYSVYIDANVTVSALTGVVSNIKLETYDGSTWTEIATLDSGTSSSSYDDTYVFEDAVQGVRVRCYGTGTSTGTATVTCYWTEMIINELDDTSLIVHDITSGEMPTTISSAIANYILNDNETGTTVDFKFENSTEDSGWLDFASIETFTAFTSEPTTLTVRLTRNSSTANALPEIKGFSVIAE